MENLTIIVVTHNRLEYTKRTLESLLRTVPNAKIWIFDNYSDKDTRDYFYEFGGKKNIEIILSNQNQGWGSAVNEMINYIGDRMTEYVLISNNDVEYQDGWYEKCLGLYQKYPQIGLLAVWKHTAHGIKEDKGDLIIKDQMPAVGWLFKHENLVKFGKFPEKGPCFTKGGNGEDVGYCIIVSEINKMWVAAPKEDLGWHLDGY